jgi:hypothetical protein
VIGQTTLFDAAQNRDAVYFSIQNHLSGARAQVLIALWEIGRGTDNDIARKLNWEINRVTGRRNELETMHLIRNVGQLQGPYKYPRTIWEVDELQVNYFLSQQSKE